MFLQWVFTKCWFHDLEIHNGSLFSVDAKKAKWMQKSPCPYCVGSVSAHFQALQNKTETETLPHSITSSAGAAGAGGGNVKSLHQILSK